MDAHEALADLKQISVQIEAAVIADHGGAVQACSPDDASDGRAARAARARALGGGRRPRAATSVATRSRRSRSRRRKAACSWCATPRTCCSRPRRPIPTVGLVFYDLKSALHALDGRPAAAARSRRVVRQADAGASGGRRWRGVSAVSAQSTLAVGSAAGSVLILKRKRGRNASRADLYFDDGSMLSLGAGRAGGRAAAAARRRGARGHRPVTRERAGAPRRRARAAARRFRPALGQALVGLPRQVPLRDRSGAARADRRGARPRRRARAIRAPDRLAGPELGAVPLVTALGAARRASRS